MAIAPTRTLVVQPAEGDTPVLAEPVALVNPDGSVFKPGGDAPTTIPTGALTATAPVTATRNDDGIVNIALAADAIPAAPTADTLSGATAVGRSVMKAADAAAARTAIGAGTSSFSGKYTDLTGAPTIPAAPTWANISGKPAAAAAIADLTAAPTAADVNKILAALRTFGVIAK